tara:strand:+ start:1970 stop:2887 length:918 start_codon:yes stop_codon:yes gene_type:complete
MINKHLEHPEDSILNKGKDGALEILKFFKNKSSKLSVKYDGAPAIVWGINPLNDKFFVGTKSVFNKKKIKINYSHYDIEVNHGDKANVASILHLCYEKLPRIEGVYQCDFIGFGGGSVYNPNTITYKFDDIVEEDIIIAAHTTYDVWDVLSNSVAIFEYKGIRTEEIKFLSTDAKFAYRDIKLDLLISLAQAAVRFVKFPDKKQGETIKVTVNSYIREQKDLDPNALSKETGFHANLFHLYNFIRDIKLLLMEGITTSENVETLLDTQPWQHEGYVMSNSDGIYKLVNRKQFSYANFNVKKDWKR